MLFDVRYELAKSRIMDTNLENLQEHLIDIFSAFDNGSGLISIYDIKDALNNSKKLTLTPFQTHVLTGYSEPDDNGNVKYKEFAFKC